MTMENLPEPPEYEIAGKLIAHLRGDETLRPYVYDKPWDAEEQNQALAMAAAQYKGCIAVAPQLPATNPNDADTKAGTLNARLGVVVLCTRNIPGGGSGRMVAALLYKAINGVLRWKYSDSGIPYEEPRVESISTLQMQDMPKLENLHGAVAFVAVTHNYQGPIK